MDLIDTDVFIDVQRGVLAALAWFEGLNDHPVTSGFVGMELIQSAKNKEQLALSQIMVESLIQIWPTPDDCRRAARDFANYHLSHGLGLLDALIAATAIGQGATLLTFNVKHFSVVPELRVAEPYVR